MNLIENKLRYILYARKSSESEDRQVQSIDDQVNKLKSQFPHLIVIDTQIEAKSAKRPSCRPVFEKVLQRIEKGEADGILCWQINRLSRNPVDSGRLQMMLQDGVIKSIQTMDREYRPSDNVLLFSVESGMANQFILDLRKNTLRGLESKVSKGWLPCLAPSGYLNDVLTQTIIDDPKRFSLVRKMWDLMLTGNYNPITIVEIANRDWGYRTHKRKHSGDRPLADSAIYKILNNKFYAGIVCYSGKEYQGAHKPMITLEEFEQVQVLLGKKNKPKPQIHEFAFTGTVRCGTCDCLVTAEKKIKHIKATGKLAEYTYYRCTHRKREIECHEPPITLGELEKQISKKILGFTVDPEFRDFAIAKIQRENNTEIEARNKIREMTQATYNETQNQLDSLTRMRYRELIDDETFKKEQADLQKQLNTGKQKLVESHDRAAQWTKTTEKGFHFATHAYAKFKAGDMQTKREIFATLGSKFILKDLIVTLEPSEWIIPISNECENIKSDIRRLELTRNDKNMSENEKTSRFEEVYSRWGHIVELVRTAVVNLPSCSFIPDYSLQG